MNTLNKLRKSGFDVKLHIQGGIIVSPASKLTEKERGIIQNNKLTIINELKQEQSYLHWHMITETEDVKFCVIPKSTLEKLKLKFPNAILIEPVETLQ